MWSQYLPEFMALAVVHALAVIAPGADFAVTVRQSLRFGVRIGMLTALGIGAAMALHLSYTLLGVGALLQANADWQRGAQLCGAGYLLYLGWQFVQAKPAQPELGFGDAQGPVPSTLQAVARGFLTNATNPKATLFFLAVFSTLVSPTTPWPVQGLYGLWMCVSTAGWFMLVSALFGHERWRARFYRISHWLERAIGLLLWFFALKLLLA